MKRILLLVVCFGVVSASGQWSRFKKEKSIVDMPYTLDTFRHGGKYVVTQRYTNGDLAKSYSQGGEEYKVSMNLSKLQEQFARIQGYINGDREIDWLNISDNLISEIRKSKISFDLSNYQTEYGFYLQYTNDKQADKARLQAEQQRATKVKDSIYRADMLVRAKEAQAKKAIEDSINSEEQQKSAQEAQVDRDQYRKTLVKKYGASNAKKILAGEVWIGMTDKMCIESLTGPNKTTKNYTAAGVTETWIYRGIAEGCVGAGCPWLDYVITFKNHKAVSITAGE